MRALGAATFRYLDSGVTTRAEHRRGARLRVLALAALLLAWVAFVAFGLLSARSDLGLGMKSVDAAREQMAPVDLAEGRPLAALRDAHERFSRAHARVGSPILAPLRFAPVLGRQLQSVIALSAAADEVTAAGIEGVVEAQRILDDRAPATTERPRVFRRVGELAARIDQRLANIQLGPRKALLGPLGEARDELAAELVEARSGLRRASEGAMAVAHLLEGPRRYLVLAANNAEMRAGSGMFLSVGELQTGNGALQLGELKSVTEMPIPTGVVPLTGDLADRWGWLKPNEDWTSLMVSPRFDVMAPLAAQLWVATGHAPVDGVLALDPVAMQALLGATGPIRVGDRQIDDRNVVEELLHGQYLRFTGDERPERREELGRIAGAVFSTLDQGGWSPARLAAGLARAARGRHVLLWSAVPAEQNGWTAAGVDGSLHAKSLMVSILNRGGNKLDQFLRVTSDLNCAPKGPGSECTVRVAIRNDVPMGEPRYVSGPHPRSGVGEGVYVGILAVNVPGAAEGSHYAGVEELAVAGADGPTRVIAFQFSLARGEERTVELRFGLPEQHGALTVEPSARVPPLTWSSGPARWGSESARTVSW